MLIAHSRHLKRKDTFSEYFLVDPLFEHMFSHLRGSVYGETSTFNIDTIYLFAFYNKFPTKHVVFQNHYGRSCVSMQERFAI